MSDLTVGQLIEILQAFPVDLPMVIETPGMEFQTVAQVNPPCGDEDEAQRGVCLIGGRYL